MKRLNITIDHDTYENARIAAFLTKSNISSIIRKALNDWFKKNKLASKKELILQKAQIKEVKEILENDEFVDISKVKEELGL